MTKVENHSIAGTFATITGVPIERAEVLGHVLTDHLQAAQPKDSAGYQLVFREVELIEISSPAEREFVLCMLGFMVGANTITQELSERIGIDIGAIIHGDDEDED